MKSLSIIVLAYVLGNPHLTCSDFKTGTFDLPSVDGSVHRIIRTEKKQIEFVGKSGLQSEFDIKWVSDCKYIIYNRRVLKGKDVSPEHNNDTLICEVKSIKGSTFIVTSFMRGFDKTDCEMKKIK
jgi:hypothetical protein